MINKKINVKNELIDHALTLERELKEARAEIAILRKDAERLDYLDTLECGIDHRSYGEYRNYIGEGFTQKIREVIDRRVEASK
jgi:hypothetical protein